VRWGSDGALGERRCAMRIESRKRFEAILAGATVRSPVPPSRGAERWGGRLIDKASAAGSDLGFGCSFGCSFGCCSFGCCGFGCCFGCRLPLSRGRERGLGGEAPGVASGG
jgi:hypothetical protein